jgi:iron complex outermembrane receptor protein
LYTIKGLHSSVFILTIFLLLGVTSTVFAASSEDELEQSILNELSLEALYNLPIVEIATGTAVPLEKAPAVASLITAEDIKAMGALTVDEVLESVAGLHVMTSTVGRIKPVYSFRGLYTAFNPQVVLLLNGKRMVGSLYASNTVFLGSMNVGNISRIEVVRGPGSALYGADAYAGVINIITKSAKELNGFHAGVRAGSNETKNIWAQYGTSLGHEWELALNLEYFTQDTDTSRKVKSDLQTAFDQAPQASPASQAPGPIEDRFEATTYNIHLNNQNWNIGLDGYVKRDAGIGVGIAQALDKQGNDNYDQYLFTLGYKNKDWLDNWLFEGQFSYSYADSKPELGIFPSGTVLPVGDDGNIFTPFSDNAACLTANIPGIGCVTTFSEGYLGNPRTVDKIPTIDFTAGYDGLLDHNFRFGVGFKKEEMDTSESKNFGPGVLDRATLGANPNPVVVSGRLTSVSNTPYIFAPDKDRHSRYVSLQDIWELDVDWTLTAGVRYDDYSDFGSTTNPRVALVWTPTANLVTKLLYGEAFRAPTFAELYSQNNPIVLGNADLDPETIKTTELAFNYEFSAKMTAGLNLYYYTTKDMVEFVANGDGTSTAQNNKNLTGKGVELEGRWKINKQWLLLANYAYQSTKNDDTNKQVEFVPQQQFYIDARWQFKPEWQLSSQLNWVGDRERAAGDTRKDIQDYALVNMTLRRSRFSFGESGKNWEIAASIKNIFDENAYEPSNGTIPDDYPLNERRFYAEIRYYLPK